MRLPGLSAFVVAVWGFLFSSAVAGQIIFHAQGDSPAISFRYGLLYVVYAGVPGAIRGDHPFVISLLCQLITAGFFYWMRTKLQSHRVDCCCSLNSRRLSLGICDESTAFCVRTSLMRDADFAG